MSFQASFKQILREKMGSAEASSSQNSYNYADSDPAHLAYLMSQVGKFEFKSNRGQYPRPAIRPQPVRPAHVLSPSQKHAFEFLKSYIYDLSEGFTAVELKKAFRRAAMILHPDRGGNTQNFMELKEHYATLKEVVEVVAK